MNLNEMIEAEIENGYGDINAQAKVCQDIILKAIAAGPLNRNVTIKGGVVMRSKTGNVRRATQDLDLDFIRYSLADDSIDAFIEKLNCIAGITLKRTGKIEELKQQDYHGKRVSLRVGELLGLTWDCLDISDEAIAENRASLTVNKELQRVTKEAIKTLDGKDIILEFPSGKKKGKSVLVLKLPKTESSIRKVYLPKSVAQMLVEYRREQEELKEFFEGEYTDYNLVLCSYSGSPLSQNQILKKLKKLIRENNLPPVVFHSLRHSSVTYKLKLNGGDIKSVQGDSGHSQVDMVTDVYSHIIDEDRRKNAELFEEAFYKRKNLNPNAYGIYSQEPTPPKVTVPENIDPVLLQKVLSNPEMAALVNALAASMEKQ